MKRSILIVSASLLLLSGSFSACKEKVEDTKIAYSAKEGRYDLNETEYVRMYFSPESGFINSPVELIFENHTEGVLTFGTDFSLEYFDKDSWTKIQLDIAFENIELSLGAGEIRKGQFDLSKYNNGKKGRYRYAKRFGVSYDFPFGIDNSFNLYAEFEIQ